VARVDAARVLPRDADKRAWVESMFDRVAPTYERVNSVISLGQDRHWRRDVVTAVGLPPGSTVLDVACGTGDLCRALVGSGHRAVGVDLSAGMLAAARADAGFVRGDALALPVRDDRADGLVCGFALRNFVALEPFFAECARVLRPGGRFVAIDAAVPGNRLARIGHGVWFRRVVPCIGGRLSGQADAYRYLPASTAYLPDGPVLVALLRDAGFADVERVTRMAGAVQLLSGTRRSA
jgi:demethylmenaquinone methyltransferase / 2-methoxy-6-polyprenyl-1,4-benzoquinol methylase